MFLFLKPVINLSCFIGYSPSSFMWRVTRVIIFSWDRPCLQLFFWLSYSQKLPSLDYKLYGDPSSEAFHDLTPVCCSSFSFWHCSLPNCFCALLVISQRYVIYIFLHMLFPLPGMTSPFICIFLPLLMSSWHKPIHSTRYTSVIFSLKT